MINVNYRIFNPTGNITALVDSFVIEINQPTIAKEILDMEPSCEQVGFVSDGIEGADITLRMAGGEFCGNATMSTAVYFCEKEGLKSGETKEVNVKVIGTDGLVPVTVTNNEGIYNGTVKMPRVVKIFDELFTFEGHNYRYPVVSFAGISHVIADDSMSIYMAENAIKPWCDRLKCDGLGIMLVNKERTRIQPLVYVKNPETLFWESSCASGTTAAGAYFSKLEGKNVEYSFKEPGGILKIKASSDGDLYLTGTVEIR